MKAQTFLIFYM